MAPTEVELATLTERLEGVCDRLEKVETSLKTGYVTQAEFRPVHSLVFGGVALVLTGVFGALIALVVRR